MSQSLFAPAVQATVASATPLIHLALLPNTYLHSTEPGPPRTGSPGVESAQSKVAVYTNIIGVISILAVIGLWVYFVHELWTRLDIPTVTG